MKLEFATHEFPIGARVVYRPVQGQHKGRLTRVTSAPWALGHGAVVIKVDGQSGGVSVDHLTLIDQRGLWETLLELYEEDEAALFLSCPQPLWDDKIPCVEMAKGNDLSPMWDWIEGCFGQVAT